MRYINLIVCVGFILFFTGLAAGSVGQIPRCTNEPYSMALPLTIFILMAVPSFFAYSAGQQQSLGETEEQQ